MRRLITFLLLAIAAFGTAQFKVDPQKIPIVQKKRRALLIGASDYQSLGKLKFAHSDAERFRDALSQGFGFTTDSIRLITDSPDNPIKPVAATILGELDKMLMDPILDKGDMFILYFSGHGMATAKGDYLCSTDTNLSNVESTGVPVLEVVQKLVKAKLRNVVIIADACRAGEKNEFGSELFNEARKANIAVMLGCSPGQKSYEVPALKSGAFTYFLLKALSNPKNRTESGGLWTSKVAQSVESSVFEYTLHDYGDNAQRPKSFADPTSDVMLAKFISHPDQSLSTESNEDLRMVTDPEKISDGMTEIGEKLLLANDYDKSLEACKQAISLNSGNMYAAYYASITTSYLGRSGEHEKFCNLLVQSQEPYFHNLGLVQSESRMTPVSEREKAIVSFWESSPKDDTFATIAWAKARIYCSPQFLKTLLEKIIPTMRTNSRVKTFFEAEVLVASGKLEAGLAKYREGLKNPEGKALISDEHLTILQFPILRQLRRDEELKTLMRAQFSSEQVSQSMWIPIASNLKEMGNRDAAVAIIKKGMKEPNLTEQTVELAAEIMGASLGDIVDELEIAQKSSPFSWKIRVVTAIARGIKSQDPSSINLAFEEASKYCDDDLEVISLTYRIEDSIFEDATRNFGIPAEQFLDAKELFRLMFLNKVDKIGTDSSKWYQLGDLGLSMLQGPSTYQLFKRYIKDFNASSELGSEFYTMLFRLAVSMEDDKMVEFAAKHPALAEPDRTDIRLHYSAYLISRGDYRSAKTIFESVGEVSKSNMIVKESLGVVFKARAGDVAGLNQFLKQKFEDSEGNLIAEGIAALALSDLGKDDDALEHLAKVTNNQATMISSIPLRCAERLLKILKSKGKVEQANDQLYEILKVNQSSPAVMTCFFGLRPGINSFVGHFSAETKWVSEQNYDPKIPSHKYEYKSVAAGDGIFEMTVKADGTVSGTIKVIDGESFELSGKVDEFGNLRGSATSKIHKFEVEAKLISNDFKLTETFKKSSIGQLIKVIDEKGLVINWMLPASVIKP
ncbi:MAG: caspase family protein [Armatimonadota bacterium]